MNDLSSDVRLALRNLRKNVPLSSAVVMTLVLGIGLDTGVFTLLNAIMFRAHVDRDPASYVSVMTAYTTDPAHPGPLGWSTLDDYLAFRDRTRSVHDLAAWQFVAAPIGTSADADVRALLVSCNFFALHTLERPKLGRLLQPADCLNGQPVIVLSEELWRSRFLADPGIVGRTIHFNGQPVTLVGIAPSPFAGRINRSSAWLPYSLRTYLNLVDGTRADGTRAIDPPRFGLGARLNPGFSRQDVTAEFALVASQQDRLYPGRKTSVRVTDGSFMADPEFETQGYWVIALILGALGMVALIACANVATLLLSRAAARQREIAIRLALGAGAMRLLRMLLMENIVLASIAGAASLYLAYCVPGALLKFITTEPADFPLDPDWRVFAYLGAITLVSGCLSGFAPALESLNLQLVESLKSGRQAFGGAGKTRVGNLLVGVQVALSLVLLTGAGIFVRAHSQLADADPGFESRRVLAPVLRLRGAAPKSWFAFYGSLGRRMMSLPGVESVAYASALPIASMVRLDLRLPGQPASKVDANEVSPGYFTTLGIPIVRGRALEESDSTRGVRCAVVSQSMARQFLGGDAVGKTLLADGELLEIVGVARDTAAQSYGQPDGPLLYPLWSPDARRYRLLVRFSGDSGAMSLAAQAALRELAPDAFIDARSIRAWMEERLSRFWTMVELVILLGVIAMVLAVVGIYGVVSFSVGQRTKEVGIRLALGAQKGDIYRAVVAPSVRPLAKGLFAGLILTLLASVALEQLFRGLPFRLQVRDPGLYSAVALLLMLAAMAAMVGPARRAAACDPVEALREE